MFFLLLCYTIVVHTIVYTEVVKMEGPNLKSAMLLVCAALCLICVVLPTASAADLTTPIGEEGTTPDTNLVIDEMHKFHKDMDVWMMLMLVAFLMLFIKKFEWGVCLATLLTTAGSFLGYVAIKEFMWGWEWNQDLVLMGIICAITIVIGIGVFLGTIKMWQYLLVGLLFAPVFVAVEWFMFYFLEGVIDPGGSMLVHMVAAYFGWGVILALQEKRAFDEPMNTTTHSVSFVWLASMLLFVLWPSFVTALLPANMVSWGMFTCYMAGLGSVISTYFVCMALEKKVNPLVYTYAMLGGMVAIGSPLLSVGPWGALLIGLIAGVISATSFIKLAPWLHNKTGVLDVMGVNNLHGVCGWWGAISCAIITANFINIVSAVGVFVVALIGGLITGLIVRATRGRMDVLFADKTDFLLWHPEPLSIEDDKVIWEK